MEAWFSKSKNHTLLTRYKYYRIGIEIHSGPLFCFHNCQKIILKYFFKIFKFLVIFSAATRLKLVICFHFSMAATQLCLKSFWFYESNDWTWFNEKLFFFHQTGKADLNPLLMETQKQVPLVASKSKRNTKCFAII